MNEDYIMKKFESIKNTMIEQIIDSANAFKKNEINYDQMCLGIEDARARYEQKFILNNKPARDVIVINGYDEDL